MDRRQFLRLGLGCAAAAAGASLQSSGRYTSPVPDAAKPLYTFDDMPYDKPKMAEVLDVLRNGSCQARFYFTGTGIKKYPDSVDMIIDAGYPVGWHSMRHDRVSLMRDGELVRDIAEWKTCLDEVCPGYSPSLARFPYGSGRKDQIRILREEGLLIEPCAWGGVQPVNWDVDTFDWHPWKMLSPSTILSEIDQTCLASGSAIVILLHLNLAKPAMFSLARKDLIDGPGDLEIDHSMITDSPAKLEQILV